MMKGLKEFLNESFEVNQYGLYVVEGDFIVPGYWAALAAYGRENNIAFEQLKFTSEHIKRYALAHPLIHKCKNRLV